MKPLEEPPLTKKSAGSIIILGAGPAGLACAHELSLNGLPSTVIDRNDEVGGLLRTLKRDDYLFDIGGHRFLSKSPVVNHLWKSLLGDDLLRVKRKSRILYNKNLFDYPLKAFNALSGLGLVEAIRCIASYWAAKIWPPLDQSHLEGWMVKRFGRRLYEIFFKSYTEKVWGIPCSQISSDWADQRIEDMSLWKAVRKSIFPGRTNTLKTLSQEFIYPKLGPGLFCDRLKEQSSLRGTEYLLQTSVDEIHHQDNRLTHVVVSTPDGRRETLRADSFFSSIPITQLIRKMSPAVPKEVSNAARNLRFRNFLVVLLVFDNPDMFSDNWIYVQTAGIRAGRIQNYKNWSPHMVPDPSKTTLGVEYFLDEDEDLWTLEDHEMIHFALHELEKMGFSISNQFSKGYVVHSPNAYPVYDTGYKAKLNLVRSFLDRFSNLQVLGRAGLFRYNNSDHALLTGIYGARNLMGSRFDLWEIDPDRVSHTGLNIPSSQNGNHVHAGFKA